MMIMSRRLFAQGFSIAQLEKLLGIRRSKLTALDRLRSKLVKRLEGLDAKIASLGGSARSRGGRVLNNLSLNESILAVLKRKGGPMTVGEIVSAVLAGGYASRSANFRGIVNQSLIKDKRFVNSGIRGSYQLRK
jgi:DNA-binding transcriptional MerR regulator